jgi:hypothetical protein
MPRQSQPRVLACSAGLDYLALSSPKSPGDHHRFVTFGHHLQKALTGDETEIKPAGLKGYKGVKVAGVSFAHRASDNHWRLAVEGPNAEVVAQAAIDAQLVTKCTRADPAWTYQLKEPFPFYGEYLRKKIRAHEKANGIAERSAFTLFEKATQDSGGTIGHRSSAIYPRIYDWMLYHHKKSNQDIWRAEMETKEEAAERVWEMMKVAPDRAKLCRDMVTTRLKQHGICPAGAEDAEIVEVVGTRPPSDWDRWFHWFTNTVLPSMDKRMQAGHFEQIRDALMSQGFVDADGMFSRRMES